MMLLCTAFTGRAQRVIVDSVSIHFPVSVTELNPDFAANATELRAFVERIAALTSTGEYRVVSSHVTGAASPEGSVEFNRELSHGRAHRINSYLRRALHTEIPDSVTSFTFVGRDWAGLLRSARADMDLPVRERVLALLDSIVKERADGIPETEYNLKRLQSIAKGWPYRYLKRNHFMPLRASRLVLTIELTDPRRHLTSLPQSHAEPPLLAVDAPAETPNNLPAPAMPAWPRCALTPFYASLSTNMVYATALIPNIGAEIYLGRGISVEGQWLYAWWSHDPSARFWRLYGGGATLRRWFGTAAASKPLTGHHIGIGGAGFIFDIEWGARGYMGGLPGRTLWDQCNYAGWVEYGYAFPISPRFNIDLTIGLGYVGGEYRDYLPIDGHYVWQSTRQLHYFGPTRAQMAIIWLLGSGNVNLPKGGERW